MDRGEAFKRGLTITPAEEGSFLAHVLGDTRTFCMTQTFAFTNVSDLLDWLVAHAQAFSADKIAADVTHELTEGDVIKSRPSVGPGLGAAIGDNPFASIRPGIRRTSAAEKMFPFTGMSAAAMKAQNAAYDAAMAPDPKPAA